VGVHGIHGLSENIFQKSGCPRYPRYQGISTVLQERQTRGIVAQIGANWHKLAIRHRHVRRADAIVVFHAFQKKSQKTPSCEIDLARQRLQEVLNEASKS
jgi:hypothetical protein